MAITARLRPDKRPTPRALYPSPCSRYNLSVEFRILGPLQVVDGDAELSLGSPMERALLAVLLLHGGDVVSRERLIDALWGESPPQTAAKALNVHVSRLRKSLARNGHDPIATRSPGYQLRIDPQELDAAQFERLVAEAREHVAAGDAESARRLFGDALSLWRGPALAGIELESMARSEISRLEQLRLAALMDRLDCDLALSLHEQVMGELEALVAEYPLYERLRGQYMLALYRSGRQADALGAYQDARRTLVDELGLEPSEALQRLERAILNHDPALELPSGRSVPTVTQPLRRRPAWRWLLLVPVAVLLAAGLAILLATRNGGGAQVPPNSVAVIDPGANKVVTSVAVGVNPDAVTVGRGSVWVANTADETVSRIDARTRRLVRTIPVGEYPSDVATAAGSAWVALGGPQQVRRIDLTRNEADEVLLMPRPTPGFTPMCTRLGMSVATGGGALWVACVNRETPPISDALHIDLRIRKVTHVPDALTVSAPVAVGLRDVAFGLGSVWYVNRDANSVAQVDAASLRKLRDVTVGREPTAVAVGFGSVWVANEKENTVDRIEVSGPTQGVTVKAIPVGREPVDVAVGDGAVWVANRGDRSVSRIDPETAKVVATIELGSEPARLAAGDGAVWVTVR
jgi:YVTN family beta-propeller protein